jgi:predicted DNA-binding protein
VETIAQSVRIAGDAIAVLAELSDKLGQSKAKVIETALQEMEERIFWEEVRESFERIAQDPVESARQKAEFDLWDAGTSRDYEKAQLTR